MISEDFRTGQLVIIENLNKSYIRGDQEIPVLRNLSLGVEEGEFLGSHGTLRVRQDNSFESYRRNRHCRLRNPQYRRSKYLPAQ